MGKRAFQKLFQDEKLFGRGSTDDKGPVVAWINALEVLQENKITVPVNIKASNVYQVDSSSNCELSPVGLIQYHLLYLGRQTNNL